MTCVLLVSLKAWMPEARSGMAALSSPSLIRAGRGNREAAPAAVTTELHAMAKSSRLQKEQHPRHLFLARLEVRDEAHDGGVCGQRVGRFGGGPDQHPCELILQLDGIVPRSLLDETAVSKRASHGPRARRRCRLCSTNTSSAATSDIRPPASSAVFVRSIPSL
jgi:ribosomal protein S14